MKLSELKAAVNAAIEQSRRAGLGAGWSEEFFFLFPRDRLVKSK